VWMAEGGWRKAAKTVAQAFDVSCPRTEK
jgi:hypothetical protein